MFIILSMLVYRFTVMATFGRIHHLCGQKKEYPCINFDCLGDNHPFYVNHGNFRKQCRWTIKKCAKHCHFERPFWKYRDVFLHFNTGIWTAHQFFSNFLRGFFFGNNSLNNAAYQKRLCYCRSVFLKQLRQIFKENLQT